MSAAIRTRRGDLQTAIRWYRQPGTDHRITVIGTIHIGEQRYFDFLRRLIDQFDEGGAAIHYELVTPADDAALAGATDDERAGVARLRVLGKGMRAIADLMALPTQHVWFPMPKHWRNVDVTDLDTIRAHPDLRFLDGMEKAAKSFEDMRDEQRRQLGDLVRFLIRHWSWTNRVVKAMRAVGLRRDDGMNEAFVLDHRNGLAVDAATGCSQRVVTVWGAGHLPGIHKLLAERGYQQYDEQWVVALRKNAGKQQAETAGAA